MPKSPRAASLILSALLVLGAFRIMGGKYLQGYVLDLGQLRFPAPLYSAFIMSYCAFGLVALVLLTAGIAGVIAREDGAKEFAESWQRATDRKWIVTASVLAGLFALMIRISVLRGAPLTDDEGAYEFMAQLVASGRLHVPSYPLKQFYDNAFMINDGRFYAKYFIGWPALLAPGAALGVPGLMNPLYLGLTVPPLYRVLQEYVGTAWARGGLVLLVAAPMLLFGAATEMSHTSCMCALAWAWYFCLRAQRPEATVRDHLGFAVSLAVASFIRPDSTLGIGTPLGLAWLAYVWRIPERGRGKALAAFGGVAVVALLCLGAVNLAQTGDVLTIAYGQSAAYDAASKNPFSALPGGYEHMQFSDPLQMIAVTSTGLMRLSFDLFGWPIGLLVVLLAFGDPRARLPFASAAFFLLLHLPVSDPGIDSFGPVHFYELALPVLLLCMIGFDRAHTWLARLDEPVLRVLSPALMAGLILIAWLGFVPVRASALVRISEDVLAPSQAIADAGIQRGVVFSPRPFAAPCLGKPTKNYVFFRPNNDPDLKNDVLWVNNLGLELDKQLMRRFPDRKGYLLVRFTDCTLKVIPLESATAELAAP